MTMLALKSICGPLDQAARTRGGLTFLSFTLMLLVSGCASKGTSGNERINAWLSSREPLLPPAIYHVEPPDTLQIVAPKIKELDGQRQTVRPDGRISFNLLGDLRVAGKTPQEIAHDLRQAAAKYYDPKMLDISVQVVEFKSKMIYVFGQVQDPGIKPFTGRETALAILAMSRLKDEAWPEKIVIVRPNEDPSIHQKVTLDVKTMYRTGDVAHDYLLESGDIVYVPPNPLAQMSATFTKLTIPIMPLANIASMAAMGGF